MCLALSWPPTRGNQRRQIFWLPLPLPPALLLAVVLGFEPKVAHQSNVVVAFDFTLFSPQFVNDTKAVEEGGGQRGSIGGSQVKGSDFSVSVCQSVNLRPPVCAVVSPSPSPSCRRSCLRINNHSEIVKKSSINVYFGFEVVPLPLPLPQSLSLTQPASQLPQSDDNLQTKCK